MIWCGIFLTKKLLGTGSSLWSRFSMRSAYSMPGLAASAFWLEREPFRDAGPVLQQSGAASPSHK